MLYPISLGLEMSFMRFMTLSLFLLFVGFVFCDGFKLSVIRKLIWFVAFLGVAVNVFYLMGKFDLSYVLPLPICLAFIFCYAQKKELEKKGK
jgi:lipid-A-disaccharide synthase-like uncharacterized protein